VSPLVVVMCPNAMARRMASAWVAATAVLALACAAGAGPAITPEQAIRAYRIAIQAAETTHQRRAIERAFTALGTLRETLTRVGDDHKTALESLPAAQLAVLRSDLRGVLLERDEAVFVEPDCPYFAALAEARGDAADRAFFSALSATYPASVWPVYVNQQTDLGGCVRFGSLSLVDTYGTWSAFRRRYPARYSAAAGREADAVALQLALSTCACDSVPDVERELEEFIQRFPRSPVRPAMEQRLNDLRAGRTTIAPHCRGPG
jgi:hypothetical protein